MCVAVAGTIGRLAGCWSTEAHRGRAAVSATGCVPGRWAHRGSASWSASVAARRHLDQRERWVPGCRRQLWVPRCRLTEMGASQFVKLPIVMDASRCVKLLIVTGVSRFVKLLIVTGASRLVRQLIVMGASRFIKLLIGTRTRCLGP